MACCSLLDQFFGACRPTPAGQVLYPLPEIMLVVLCATLAGAEDFVEARPWGRGKLAFLLCMLPCDQRARSHAVLRLLHRLGRRIA